MRSLPVILLGVLATSSLGCSEHVCDEKAGKTACRYCAQDRLATGNPHAGMCRYCPGDTLCAGDSCTDSLMCQSKVTLYIPKATFRSGPAPQGTGGSAVPPITQVTPSTNSLSPGATVQWTVQWEATLEVTAVLFDAPQLGGHFELPVTPDEASAGTLSVPMVEASTAPGESGCLGPMTCWTEAPAETTTELAVALVGAGGAVGQSMGGIGLTWSAPSFPQSTNSNPDPGDGCPTSAAAAGCCTTRNGIQVVGFGLAASCRCPSGTCALGANQCGCPACGGCN